MTRTLIVTPVQKEYNALTKYLISEGYIAETLGMKTDCSLFQNLGVMVAVGGIGKAQFAVTTQYLIHTCGPFSLVITAGTAGALKSDLHPGDVILGTETVEHDYKERLDGNTPTPRHAGSANARASIERVHRRSASVRLHIGPIASGDEDIVDAARAMELRQQTNALCVAWEGAGGARAARFNGIPFLEIRAISDAADKNALDSYRVHLPDAVKNIGRLLLPWLCDQLKNYDKLPNSI